VVAVKAEWAEPQFGIEVDHREGVEDGTADAAAEGSIRKNRNFSVRVERSIYGRNGDNTVSSILLGARYDIPGHPYPILHLELQELRHSL
jgi:hypothetical protein